MAMSYLRVNAAALDSDANELHDLLRQIKTNLEGMYSSVTALDGMWDGPANDAFNTQFLNDRENFRELCERIGNLFSDMSTAAKEYDSCENEVYSNISSLNI